MEMASSQLPVQFTSFIGRQRELAAVQRVLSTARLVTVTGAGGSGKTRLAVQAASLVGETFADGAHFVALGAISDPTLLLPTIAQALHLSEAPDRPLFESLKAFLQDRHLLLVLDNFEQVIAAAPRLSEVLAACGAVRMLVTSREALRVRGEQEFPLAPLELLDPALLPDHPAVETVLHAPAIALFVERAQACSPDFRLTADNAAAVAEVCARLDGLPLAIELATARIKLLPPQALLARLQASPLTLLTGGARDVPARQQTLRATMQWSYDLLTAEEQRTFRTLSAFVGGCTLEAASRVSGEHSFGEVLETITSLLNKSLVQQTERDGEPRVGLLETIRAFGLEQLTRTDELEAVQRAHAAYYLSLAEATEPHLAGREQNVWLQRLGREQENLRAALRWGCEQQEGEVALRLTGALWQYWFLRGQWSEGRRWLEDALALASQAEVPLALRAKALYAAARLTRYQNDFAPARVLCEHSIALYRELGDQEGLLAALLQWCRILDFQEEYEPLRTLLPEALALAEELPDVLIKAQVYAEVPIVHPGSISTGVAARYLAESERIYRALDNPAGLAFTLLLQGQLAALQGDLERAQALFDEGERLAAEVDDHHLKLRILFGHPVLAWLSGDDALARRHYEHLLVALTDMHDPTRLSSSLATLAVLPAVLHRQGLSVWAARVYGLADTLTRTSPPLLMSGELFDALRKRAAAVRTEVRARLGDVAFARAYAEGHTMTVEELLAIPHPPPDASSRAQAASASVPSDPLTARELDVLRLLAQDLSNPQIAERLVISRRTVEAHLHSLYGKCGVRSRDAAIRYAMEHGLVDK
jgi:predicted ATPase/DNA-binding CsgD family transcriptional regulator